MNTEKIFEGPGQSSMETYVIEIVIILIIAFMLGYFFCVLIKKSQKYRPDKFVMTIFIKKIINI